MRDHFHCLTMFMGSLLGVMTYAAFALRLDYLNAPSLEKRDSAFFQLLIIFLIMAFFLFSYLLVANVKVKGLERKDHDERK